jgi:hypothetical protein
MSHVETRSMLMCKHKLHMIFKQLGELVYFLVESELGIMSLENKTKLK